MKTPHSLSGWITLALLLGVQSPCLAADQDRPSRSSEALGALMRQAVPTSQLAGERARGIVVNSAASSGAVFGNTVGPHNVTGTIGNQNSINNNVGITTVFQNTGNNSLLQSSTSIYISVR